MLAVLPGKHPLPHLLLTKQPVLAVLLSECPLFQFAAQHYCKKKNNQYPNCRSPTSQCLQYCPAGTHCANCCLPTSQCLQHCPTSTHNLICCSPDSRCWQCSPDITHNLNCCSPDS